MTIDDQKEHFSYAYARAVAATAAVSVATPEVDDDSIDLVLFQKGTGTVFRSPRLELQVKCADEGTLTVSATHIHYPLKLKNYEELRADDVLVPRILVVVLVPTGLNQWLNWTHQELAVRRAGYWLSLRGMPLTPNTTNVTVHVPLANEFSVAQLNNMMQRIGSGQQL
jgi:hypothetical protein